MSPFAIIFLTILPIVYYLTCEYALSFKGCTIPALSYKLARKFLFIGLLAMLAFYPLFEDAESYLFVCVMIDAAILFFATFRLYWCIQKKSRRSLKKFPSNENYTLLGIRLILTFTLGFIASSWWILNSWEWEDRTFILGTIIYAAAFATSFIMLAFMTLTRLDRIKIPAMRSLTALRTNKPPIVLLRSFKLDKTPYWNNKTFDEALCENLKMEDSPIISLADPDELLPTGGSLKIQTKDDYWKNAVLELLMHCKAVILVEGESEGLGWEIEKVRSIFNDKPQKVFILIPPNKYRLLAWCINEQNGGIGIIRNFSALMLRISSPIWVRKELLNVWERFAAYMRIHKFNLPTVFPGTHRYIHFTNDWQAKVSIKYSNGKEMFSHMMKLATGNSSNYDYGALAEKIASYEVNEFMSPSDMQEFNREMRFLQRINNYIIILLIAIAVYAWCF